MVWDECNVREREPNVRRAKVTTLSLSPKPGLKGEIYAIVFWFFLVPVFLGYILAFVVTSRD